MSYTTVGQVEAYIGSPLTASQNQSFGLVAGATQAKIDKWLNVGWGCVDPSEKLYNGGQSEIQIDPTIEITKIVNVAKDGTESREYVLGEDVVLQPVNKAAKTWLQFRRCSPHGIANIKVYGKASRGETAPQDIQFLATYMVGRTFGDAQRGNLEEESIEGYRRKFSHIDWDADTNVQGVLSDYRQILMGDGSVNNRHLVGVPEFWG